MQSPLTRVVLVDDSEEDYLLTRILIEAMAETSAALDWVAMYEAGLDAAIRGGYDALLIDYNLGASDGLS